MASSISFPLLAQQSQTACADIFVVPMFQDNYAYVMVDRATRLAAVVDPSQPEVVVEALKTIDCRLDALLCTHKHGDHCGGNEHFASTSPDLRVISTKYEETPAVTHPVGEGDEFQLGSLTISVLHTPCHTSGHVIFAVSGPSGDPILFTGDTLFVGGCGRFFEGTAAQMLTNMDRLASHPPSSVVCCAHEYTESNLRFLVSLDPEVSSPVLVSVRERRALGMPTSLSTIGAELQYNLFMKCRESKTQELVGHTGSPVDTMAALREMKNAFR